MSGKNINKTFNAADQVERKKKSKTSALVKPGQTKSSLHRQMLAQSKKLQSISLVPDEVLYNVFQYLTASDLLRCCSVSLSWKEVALIPALWERVFKRLPKVCRDISSKAKTWGDVNWKEECIYCAKERRSRKIKKLVKDSMLDSVKKAKSQATRTMKIHWLLIFEDTDSKRHEVEADEDFIFKNGISIRWNQINSPSLSKLKNVKLYALTPLFYDKDWNVKNNSICTRSLMFVHTFKDSPFNKMKSLHGDEHVHLYPLKKYLYFALWKSSLPRVGDVAFAGAAIPLCNLLLSTQHGTSERIYNIPLHCSIPDDVDIKYGLHGYTAVVTLRNCRKVFFTDTFNEFKDGVWMDHELHIEKRRYTDYVFYDIKEKMIFLWKTAAIKGIVEDLVILDVELSDVNSEIIWSASSPVKLEKITDEQDNYSYEDCEIWKLTYRDLHAACSFEIIKNSSTKESTILSVKFVLVKNFVNEWFGTSY